jgi:hypothetical protein
MMKDHSALELNEPSSMVGTEQSGSVHPTSREPGYLFHPLLQWFITDWRTRKYFFFGALLLLINVSVAVIYYVNYPGVAFDADTPAYVHVAERLYTHPYFLVDAWRLPGYPLLIAFVYAFAGYRNWMAVSAAQDVLFVLATMEIYVLAILVFKRTWMAFLIGLIVGTNVVLISYVKPMMPGALATYYISTGACVLRPYVTTLCLLARCRVPGAISIHAPRVALFAGTIVRLCSACSPAAGWALEIWPGGVAQYSGGVNLSLHAGGHLHSDQHAAE